MFVPNARSSVRLDMKRVDRDWGGLDRLDHAHAMTEVLPLDDRVDVSGPASWDARTAGT